MPTSSYTDWLYLTSVPDSSMTSGYVTEAVQNTTPTTEQTTDDALAWMADQVAAGARHLTVVAFSMPHSVWVSGGDSWKSAVSSCGGTPSGFELANHRLAVTCLDTAVETLLDATPDLEHTLVVFLADNGTQNAVAEGGFRDGRGKATIYENGIRVPFIVADGAAVREALDAGGVVAGSGYAIDAGTVVADPTSIVDVYATVAELLDLQPGTCTPGTDCARDSVSLSSVLTGGPPARGSAWSEQFTGGAANPVGRGAVRIGDYKLIVATNGDETCRACELYDLAADRWETTSVFDDPAYYDVRAELLAELEVYAASVGSTASDWLAWDDCCHATENWYDGRDLDCDGGSDYDADLDGHDSADHGGADCDDGDPTVYPGAVDTWYDGIDQDCSGTSDWDQDGDGYDSPADCDDTNAAIRPGAVETWYDGVDQNCDRRSDYDRDLDGDPSARFGGGDCNDGDATIHTGAPDVWYDGVDKNCDGRDDYDRDLDGHRSAAYGGTDCDDANNRVFPGARELPGDGVDQNCDGSDLN